MIKNIKYLLLILLTLNIALSQETRLLRYPNSSETEITFSHSGDIYVVPINGGLARKITSSEGFEIYPRFSPDGKNIAFNAEYDGNREIYLVPSIGGEPVRLTYSMDQKDVADRQGPDKIIMSWVNNDEILFRSRAKSWNILVGQLYTVNKSGALPTEIAVPRGGFASFNSDGSKMAYNRIFREYRTWKRYSGGQADEIWIYDFKSKQIENISNTKFQDIIPMWSGNKIYYLSDRDFTMNLFCYDLTTKQTKKITDFNEFDVKFPSLGAKHITFENGGYIYLLDVTTDKYQKVNITIGSDYPLARNSFVNVKDKITTYDLSIDGKRALFTARGDIFSVPAEKGNIKNYTNSPGVHDRNATWSNDGNFIAFISDRSGNDEIYITKADGSDISQITNNAEFYRYDLKCSPDNKKIVTYDNARNLVLIDILTKKQTIIAKSKVWPISDAVFSPDSKWIAYTDYINDKFGVIKLYSIESAKSTQVTSEFFSSSQPVFTPGGKYLLFISERSFSPIIGNFEYNFVYNNMSNIFGLTLQETEENPFAKYESDEVGDEEKKLSKKEKEIEANAPIKIDLNGIINRIFEVPTPAGNYSSLMPLSTHKLYYVRSEQSKKSAFYYYDFVEKKENEVGDITSFVISANEKSILFKMGSDYYITKLTEKLTGKDGKLELQNLTVNLNRNEEWKQVFTESWRHLKYFFYDPSMHGYNWDSIRIKYEQLLPYVHHRGDLTYIIGEMIGELDAGHAYVSGGDMPKVKAVQIGLLGIDISVDSKANAFRIDKILQGQNWDESLRSPLTEPGLNVKVGDYLLAIDGIALDAKTNPFQYLLNKANKFVKLTINSSQSMQGSREITVKTIGNEAELRYIDWVENNRRKVDSMTNGRIGYIHVPDMMPSNGLNWFVKQFYPQLRKEGLIIDDRYNGGGNVSPMIIERLRRELVIAKAGRNQEMILTNPDAVMTGPMVCLINEQSMSDGDLFPYQFKTLKLGPVIGKRSWGGVVGIYGSLPLLDGSSVNKPEVANFGADGNWVLEDVGMVPDIEVDNHPAKEYIGIDEQLIRGVEEINKLLLTNPKRQLPKAPPYPNKKGNFGK